jgi:hypothetical protein
LVEEELYFYYYPIITGIVFLFIFVIVIAGRVFILHQVEKITILVCKKYVHPSSLSVIFGMLSYWHEENEIA